MEAVVSIPVHDRFIVKPGVRTFFKVIAEIPGL